MNSKCRLCNGEGGFFFKFKDENKSYECFQCEGTGYVSWIDEILGRNKTLDQLYEEVNIVANNLTKKYGIK